MPGMAAPLFHAAFAGGEVQFVMEDGHVGGGELVEIQRRADSLRRRGS
ncbi:MAG: hypothetical protein Q27BPR15_15820 [Rhodobacter sp. CACIA14H1]|nr:MAG: hypothetical protein Q27BPR15_15820 [Rhodobacter sp. CACIA14H1]